MALSRLSPRIFATGSVIAIVISGCSPIGSGGRFLSSLGDDRTLDSYVPPKPRPSTSLNAKMCQSGPSTVAGIDVSAWNPNINWPRIKMAGRDFVFIKATEGTSYVSGTFPGDWAEAKAAGILRGAYHYFRPGSDPVEQAQIFLETMGELGADDLPALFDWEEDDGISPAVQIARAKTWLLLVEQATGKIPIIYTGPSFWNSLGNPTDFIRHALFIANYQVNCPWTPAPWTTWTFWQHTDQGIVDGSPGELDLDHFNGTLEELRRFARYGFL